MALSFTDPVGGTIYIPGAYPNITVQPNNAGLSTTGVLALVGEADSGPDFSQETELADNAFGPDQVADVVAKYGSGRLVDAFKAAAAAAVDPDISAAFSSIILVKTNVGVKASYALNGEYSATAWSTLRAKAAGANGNLIYFTNLLSSEVRPTTGSFTYIPSGGVAKVGFVVNGLPEADTVNLTADYTPAQAQVAIDNVAGVLCTGGTARNPIVVSGANALTITLGIGNSATFTLNVAWPAAVQVGDTLVIPAGSLFAGGGPGYNLGGWVVTSVNGVNLVATKLSDGSTTPGFAVGVVTVPITIGPINPVGGNGDLQVYAPLVISNEAGNPIPGMGKTLEVVGIGVGGGVTDVTTNLFYALSTTRVTWVSTSGRPRLLTSSAEPVDTLNLNRQLDNVSENIVAGGEIAMQMSYTGYSCTVEITATDFVIVYQATNPGVAVTLTLPLSSYPTIADLCSYIASLPNFLAQPFTAVLGNLPSTALDATTWGGFSATHNCATTFGALTGRFKIDAYRFWTAMQSSVLGELSVQPLGGLPIIVASFTYLSGGAKGGSTNTSFSSGIDALQRVRCNFVVPLISADYTVDFAAGQTDSSSTYTVDFVNAYVKSHVAAMSTMKARRNRQGFLSKRDTFTNVSNAAANIASYRCSMVFQDFKAAISGAIVQYQPWMAAVNAAAMQAGAFYKSLVNKQTNTSGVIQAAGDWSYNFDSDLNNALKAGLLPVKKAETGGFVWVSDQTTYGRDASSFYNSIQMVYAGDTVALTTAQRMEAAFVGKSLADVTAAQAHSFLDGIMADFLRLKLIAPSDDAPQGYKNARVVIQGPVMRVSVEVKLAGSIYFIPISFYVTEITQTA